MAYPPPPHGHVSPPQQFPQHGRQQQDQYPQQPQQPPYQQPLRPPPGSARAGVPLRGPHPVGAHGPGSARYWNADPEERQMGMFVHLGGLLTGFITPLIIYVLKKDESPFIRDQARHSLNAQISYLIWTIVALVVFSVVGFVLALVTFGLGFFLMYVGFVPLIALLAFEIIACIKANDGEGYRIPFSLDLVK